MLTVAWAMGGVGLALYWYVAFLYLGDTRRQLAGLESPTGPQEV
jgi:hypothetical protein